MVVELVGGPLDGVIHELHGTIVPESFGLLNTERTELHWYMVESNKTHATYAETVKVTGGGNYGSKRLLP